MVMREMNRPMRRAGPFTAGPTQERAGANANNTASIRGSDGVWDCGGRPCTSGAFAGDGKLLPAAERVTGRWALGPEGAGRGGGGWTRRPRSRPRRTMAIPATCWLSRTRNGGWRNATECRTHGVAVSSVAMGLLNGFPMVSDPRAMAWVEQTIDGTKDLGANVMLMAFFGKGTCATSRGH